MKITKTALTKIIQEEFAKVIKEMDDEGEWAKWAYDRFDMPGYGEEAAGPPKVRKEPETSSDAWKERDRMRYSDQYDELDAYQNLEEQ
jgi:hypothetical protein